MDKAEYLKLILDNITDISNKISNNKPRHYKVDCQCQLCYNYNNLCLSKQNLETYLFMFNNNEILQ